MGHKTIAIGYKADDFIGKQVGLDGRNSVPAYLRVCIQGLDEVKNKASFWAAALRWPRCHCQNRQGLHPWVPPLLPHGRNFVGVFHNVGHSITATSATGLGMVQNYIYSRNHPAPWGKNGCGRQRKRTYKLVDLVYIARFDQTLPAWLSSSMNLRMLNFFCSSKYQIDTGNRRNFFRLPAGHNSQWQWFLHWGAYRCARRTSCGIFICKISLHCRYSIHKYRRLLQNWQPRNRHLQTAGGWKSQKNWAW